MTGTWNSVCHIDCCVHRLSQPNFIHLHMAEYCYGPICQCPVHAFSQPILLWRVGYRRQMYDTVFSTYTRETSVVVLRSIFCPDTLNILGQLILHKCFVLDESIRHFQLVFDIVCDYISRKSSINDTTNIDLPRDFVFKGPMTS